MSIQEFAFTFFQYVTSVVTDVFTVPPGQIDQKWLYMMCTCYLRANNVLDWPPYSPDHNPIENLWPRVHALMDRLMPTSDEQVADAFVECWPQLSLDIFTDFAKSTPARIQAVIVANDDATKYYYTAHLR